MFCKKFYIILFIIIINPTTNRIVVIEVSFSTSIFLSRQNTDVCARVFTCIFLLMKEVTQNFTSLHVGLCNN